MNMLSIERISIDWNYQQSTKAINAYFLIKACPRNYYSSVLTTTYTNSLLTWKLSQPCKITPSPHSSTFTLEVWEYEACTQLVKAEIDFQDFVVSSGQITKRLENIEEKPITVIIHFHSQKSLYRRSITKLEATDRKYTEPQNEDRSKLMKSTSHKLIYFKEQPQTKLSDRSSGSYSKHPYQASPIKQTSKRDIQIKRSPVGFITKKKLK